MTEIDSPAPILLITGVMAAGKSTVADHLAKRFSRSIHLRGDLFRRMIVNGRVDMSDDPAAEAMRQLQLRYRAAAQAAKLYSSSGFHVIYQDVVIGPVLEEVISIFDGYPLHVVVLCPDEQTIADREAARDKTGYTQVSIPQLQSALQDTPQIGLWIDSSNQTVQETADAIVSGLQQAMVFSA